MPTPDAGSAGAPSLVNGYAVLWFRRDARPTSTPRFAFLTPSGPETAPDRRHKLMVTRAILDVNEAMRLWCRADAYCESARAQRTRAGPVRWQLGTPQLR